MRSTSGLGKITAQTVMVSENHRPLKMRVENENVISALSRKNEMPKPSIPVRLLITVKWCQRKQTSPGKAPQSFQDTWSSLDACDSWTGGAAGGGTVAQRAGEGVEGLPDPLALTDPLFMFKFSALVVFTLRLRDKGDSFWKDWSFFGYTWYFQILHRNV